MSEASPWDAAPTDQPTPWGEQPADSPWGIPPAADGEPTLFDADSEAAAEPAAEPVKDEKPEAPAPKRRSSRKSKAEAAVAAGSASIDTVPAVPAVPADTGTGPDPLVVQAVASVVAAYSPEVAAAELRAISVYVLGAAALVESAQRELSEKLRAL